MNETLTRTQVRCKAEIRRNSYGAFLVWLSGAGYKTPRTLPRFDEEPRAAEDALDALVAEGYELLDPDHLIDLYDLFDEPMGIAELDADGAERAQSNRGPVVTAELAGAFTPRCDH